MYGYLLNDVWKLLLLKMERLQHIQIPTDFIIENTIFPRSALALHYSFVSDLLFLQGPNRTFCIHRTVKLSYSCRKMRSLHLLFFLFFFLFYHYTKNCHMACFPDSAGTNVDTNVISSC